MAGRKRKNQKNLYFSDNEIQMIKDRMERSHKDTFADYARHMLINGCIFVIDDSENLKALTYKLNKIGTNINQIAHVANATGNISAESVEQLKEMMEAIWQYQRSILSQTQSLTQLTTS